MRMLSALIFAGLIGGAAGYVAPVPRPVESQLSPPGAEVVVSPTSTGAAELQERPGESARRLIGGILASGARVEVPMPPVEEPLDKPPGKAIAQSPSPEPRAAAGSAQSSLATELAGQMKP
jgi:hypothetical protein